MTPEKIRLRALQAALELRAPATPAEAIIANARTFEAYLAGDKPSPAGAAALGPKPSDKRAA
jgi:hypothetical protein